MHPLRLIVREILHRKINFALGAVAAAVAVSCLVGSLVLLKKHDARTEQLLAAKESETRAKMAALEDDYRKITKGLGFNVLILPQQQNLSDLFADDYATNYMPESYVSRLATSRVATIQHLLPSLQQKVKWPEVERTIILVGVRGEVPIMHADPKKPILEPVPSGSMVVGYELHRSLKLAAGQKVKLLGHEFTISKLHPERGTKDDITLWIDLKTAQQLLGKTGQINGIWALECVCAADSLAKVRAEIGKVLPDTQVIELHSQTLARAEARQRAATEARDALAREKQHRARLREQTEGVAGLVVPGVGVVAGLWIAFLSLANVRERRAEIGLWRALGVSSGRVLLIFLGRAMLMGAAGAAVGYLVGLTVVGLWGEQAVSLPNIARWFDYKMCLGVLAGTPLVAALAGWLPSFMAAQQDPAEILARE